MSKLSKVNHAAGIFADMSVDGPAIGTLVAIIDRAKNLPNRKTMGKQNPYCAARLGKEAKKTQTDMRGGQTPRWDHELRFTVHESPDYFKLKVSVFNDDKKTDLIGETWVDLQNLIIPGGSQDDQWHSLQCRGKYAGDIRIEMTYYDTRQQDEAVIEKRKEAAEKVQNKAAPPSSSSGLSGPRQLNQVKRRPLPSGPASAAPPRPATEPVPVSTQAPLQHPVPSRPIHEPPTMLPAPGNDMPLPYPTQHEPSYDKSSYAPPQARQYESDGYQRERANTHEVPYHTQEMAETTYGVRPLQPRSRSDHDDPRDYRSVSHEPAFHHVPGRPSPQEEEIYSPLSPQYSAPPLSFGPVSTFTPRNQTILDGREYDRSRPNSSSGPVEDIRYQSHDIQALQPIRRDSYHPEYAGMQPRMAQMAPAPSSTKPVSSYQAYIPGSSTTSMPASLVAGYETENQADRTVMDRGRRRSTHFDDEMMLTQPASAPAPAPAPGPAPAPAPSHYDYPVYPLRTSPHPMDDRPSSRRSASPDNRPVTRSSVSPQPSVTRKSVSPRPSIQSDRGSSIPFSPDSYDSINPRAPREITSREISPAYETLSQARDAATRAESEPARDLDHPIIGDDGREIDPSDHLPTDTWAPEPERKNRKPEVIIRFKHTARPTSRGNDAPARTAGPPRVGFRTSTDTIAYPGDRKRYTTNQEVDRTPPRAQDYGNSYSQSRAYSTPTSAERPRSSQRSSVSPTPSSRSPIYEYNPGPPIPSKVPVSPGPPSYPVASGHSSGGHPLDALSRELKTIDIGSAGCSPSRAIRKYQPPRVSASMGYAS
ncbi:hypothetical protein N7468_009416 [Penicillium chermesinum]|uniref:C2 domain-containing protein n=1 Tax=Penicillium chermesinum TaxID=63820 RepID=A0A9W9NHS4_9EURO|nr:uncharacterized protein N7468_009416 [Penicillium chermesinum]KAJ5220212.1 hypothetical protein N7468_009416 [Penicillium chermesinum]